jgi:hypothetical protein
MLSTLRQLLSPNSLIQKKDIAMDEVPSSNAAPNKLSAAVKNMFLAALSETANVSASARKAQVATSTLYSERRRFTKFRSQWAEALCEGYVRLESDLLAEALRKPSAKTGEMMLKVRAQKQRLGTTLLSMHRQSVKAQTTTKPVAAKHASVSLTTQLLAKLMAMRSNNDNKRMAQDRSMDGAA